MPTPLVSLSTPVEIFNGAAAVSSGSVFAAPAEASMLSWQVFYGTPPASITMSLQASNELAGPFTVIDTTTTLLNGSMRISFASARFLRINISAVSGGDTVRVVLSAGSVSSSKDLFGGDNLIQAQAAQVSLPAGGAESDFFTYTIPARTFIQTNRSIRLRAFGKTAANANVKTVSVRVGADLYVVFSGAISNLDWNVEYIIMRRTFDIFIRRGNTLLDGVLPVTSVTTAALSEVDPILLRLTGQSAAAADILCEGVILDSLPGIPGTT